MKTICKTVYSFSELSEEAKDNAVSQLWDINTNDEFWFEHTVNEDFPAICEILGIDLNQRNGRNSVYFSGFSSQGDGACFEGSYQWKSRCVKEIRQYAPMDNELHAIADSLAEVQKSNFYQLSANIRQVGHYHGMSVYVERSDEKAISGDAENVVEQAMRDLANWLYRTLESEYDYQNSREQVIETIEANEYEFNEDGTLA